MNSQSSWQWLTSLDERAYLVHKQWMQQALKLAKIAGSQGDIPVGAVIVDRQGNLIAQAANRKEKIQDSTAHAEIIALRIAAKVKENWHLNDCILYVTLEPCPMCIGAIIQARIDLLVYGIDDPKTGAVRTVINLPDSNCSNHKLKVLSGIEATQCRQQLQQWFAARRN